MNLRHLVNEDGVKTSKPQTESIQNMNFALNLQLSNDGSRLIQSPVSSNSTGVNWTNQKSPFVQSFSSQSSPQNYFASQRQNAISDSYKYSHSSDMISNTSAYAQRTDTLFMQKVYFHCILEEK